MYCTKCGLENINGAKFCSSCGSLLSMRQTTDSMLNQTPPLNKKNSKNIIIRTIILIIIISFFVWIVYNIQRDKKTQGIIDYIEADHSPEVQDQVNMYDIEIQKANHALFDEASALLNSDEYIEAIDSFNYAIALYSNIKDKYGENGELYGNLGMCFQGRSIAERNMGYTSDADESHNIGVISYKKAARLGNENAKNYLINIGVNW